MRSTRRSVVVYYLVWFVVVPAGMATYNSKTSNPSPAVIFLVPTLTFVAPLLLCLLLGRLQTQEGERPAELTAVDLTATPAPPPIPEHHNRGIALPGVRSWRAYTHAELAAATQDFDEKNIIGAGGEACVFRGTLEPCPAYQGEFGSTHALPIAVKRFYHVSNNAAELEQADVQFRREVQALSRASHRNVVVFLGCCIHGRERFLVYELMANGSLHDWLFAPMRDPRRVQFEWGRRLAIARDAARGLDYLHNDCNDNLLHLDIKPQNILLDEKMNAKIADFGLSKLICRDQSRLRNTQVGGTLGYRAPELNVEKEEWERSSITKKADVYSFGVVLLQLVSRRTLSNAPTAPPNPDSTLPGLTFRDAAFHLVRTEQTHMLLDGGFSTSASSRSVGIRTAEIGAQCVEINPTDRPDMHRVSEWLEGIV